MLAAMVIALIPAAAGEARSRVPLRDPVLLNIGFVCQWQQRCMANQQMAMQRALKYIAKHRPPSWRVQMCNRNASRRGTRKDWIGFDNCLRNAALRPPPPRRTLKRRAQRRSR
jgi:hypothetical protein